MRNTFQESVFYSPWCGWIPDRPEVHFNNDILCEGEPLKIIATRRKNAFNSSPVLHIYDLNDDEEKRSLVAKGRLLSSPLFPFVQAVGTGAEELLQPGPYVAEVLDPEDKTW